jgi:hypothetical protein
MKLPDLNKVLEYKNSAVLKLYRQNYPNNKLTAEEAFEEALKYLWICQKLRIDHATNPDDESLPKGIFMPRSMREVDEMWHEFILFTEAYVNFCGEYMHHLPNIFDNDPMSRNEVEDEMEKILPYVYDLLGEETVSIWFSMYLNDDEMTKDEEALLSVYDVNEDGTQLTLKDRRQPISV